MRQQIYAFIVDDIVSKIKQGKLNPEEKLPPERIFCEQYGASQSTVKKALKELISLGYISSVERVGYYVNTPKTNEYVFSLDTSLENNPSVTGVEYLPPCVVEDIYFDSLKRETSAVMLAKKVYSSKTLLMYEEKYICCSKGMIFNSDNDNDEVFKKLENISGFTEESTLDIRVVITDKILAEKLGVKENIPFFSVKKTEMDRYKKPIGFTLYYYRFNVFEITGSSEE